MPSAGRSRVGDMEMGGQAMDPGLREDLANGWKGLMVAGVLAIVAGCVAILVPAVASVATAIFIGWILIIAGVFLIASAFGQRSAGRLVWRLLWAILTVAVGLYLVTAPLDGTFTLTVVLGIYFFVMGLTRVIVAIAGRGEPGAGLVGLSGVAAVLVGALILAKLPESSDWAVGLLVGIDLIFAGWAMTSTALVGKDLATGNR